MFYHPIFLFIKWPMFNPSLMHPISVLSPYFSFSTYAMHALNYIDKNKLFGEVGYYQPTHVIIMNKSIQVYKKTNSFLPFETCANCGREYYFSQTSPLFSRYFFLTIRLNCVALVNKYSILVSYQDTHPLRFV